MIRGDLVLADDLTGALEAGALYANAGISATVELPGHGIADAHGSALVLDLETRHASAAAAQSLVAQAIREARASGAGRAYLKIDSTLRGPIGGAIAGVFEAWPECCVVLTPAYPKMGRTVCGGLLYVHGRLLAETAFAQDPLDPASTSRVAARVADAASVSVVEAADGSALRAMLGQGLRNCVIVCDAGDQSQLADLAAVVSEFDGPCVCAGSGGLLAELVDRTNGIHAHSGLIVNGSLHATSREQCLVAGSEIPVNELDGEQSDQALTQSLVSSLGTQGWAILSTGSRREDCERTTQRLASVAAAVVAGSAIDSVIVFGGDTAAEILKRLDVHTIYPVRELLPGIPASRMTAGERPLLLVTKAGGFGHRDVIPQIRSALLGTHRI